MVTEITDSTNMARAYSFLPMTWFVGATIGFVQSAIWILVISNFEKAAYRWITRAPCGKITRNIWELLLFQGIPLLSSVFYNSRLRSNVLVHRFFVP